MGVPMQTFKPHRGTGDKAMRLSSIADMIRDGMVWVPQTRWAEELVDQVSSFPTADHDDLCDSTYLALRRIRQGGFVRLSTDEKDDNDWLPARKAAYY
jgi:predicted phage terminase large subunit-like protein